MPDVILSTVKAVIRRNGRILSVRCVRDGATYCTLPGGQQRPGESLLDALRPECREEISCEITVGDLFLVLERPECGLGQAVDHYFLCDLDPTGRPMVGGHPDASQQSVDWLPAAQIEDYHLHPLSMRRVIAGLHTPDPTYCGLGS